MSGGVACRCKPPNRALWVVIQRNCNHSAFNGYRRTWSRYSAVHCRGCIGIWRTTAAYVDDLPDGEPNNQTVTPVTVD
jgi:hypothetical protein